MEHLAAQVSAHLGQTVTASRTRSGGISLRAPNGNGLFISPHNLDDISPANCAASLSMGDA